VTRRAPRTGELKLGLSIQRFEWKGLPIERVAAGWQSLALAPSA